MSNRACHLVFESLHSCGYFCRCCPDSPPIMQGFIHPVARVGSGDPVRVLRLYTMITLDEVCSIYC